MEPNIVAVAFIALLLGLLLGIVATLAFMILCNEDR